MIIYFLSYSVSAQEDAVEDEVVDDSKIETDEEPAAEEETAPTGKVRFIFLFSIKFDLR